MCLIMLNRYVINYWPLNPKTILLHVQQPVLVAANLRVLNRVFFPPAVHLLALCVYLYVASESMNINIYEMNPSGCHMLCLRVLASALVSGDRSG